MKVYNHDLFPTPVTYVEGFLPENLASNIMDYLIQSDSSIKAPHGALIGDAVSSHSQSQYVDILQLIVENVDGCKNIIENITYLIDHYASRIGHPGMTIVNSWFNIQNKGSLLKKHSHIKPKNTPIVSGALYIKTHMDSPSICFENPNPYMPLFITSNNTESKYGNSYYRFNPRIGDLILFPSWLPHFTLEPCVTDNRTVISFNAL